MVTVNVTFCPGTAAEVFADCVIDKPGTRTETLTEHAGSVVPAGQFDPAAVVVIVDASSLLPGSGFLTVTVPVTVTVPPTGMSPVQVSPVPVIVTVPEVTVWSPIGVASSNTALALVEIVIPS